jgi:hypothetical protein
MPRTVIRGLRLAKGSWKIICISRRRARSRRALAPVMSSSSNRTVPEVGSISRRTQRAVVDFPQPDSPTRAKVSPASREKEIPSTALTAPMLCLNTIPVRIG